MLTNPEKSASIASSFINCTNSNIFLTGRAGTGKTTFLKSIVNSSHKSTIVAAPTGIAAINAGGVTLHSLFQLPFGSFIPSNSKISENNIEVRITTPGKLISDLQLNTVKRKMLRELELLIIDEVSMLRADLLDAIDTILRSVRRNREIPFGGVQMLFIGDLLQLPPVVKDVEWKYLSQYYPSVFFFEAKALQNSNLKYIELEKIYRQTDHEFISILNNFRDNKVTPDDIKILNKYYKPSFKAEKNEGYINLTTHNRLADKINKDSLNSLPTQSFSYDAIIENNFNENNFPVEYTLQLKVGAQVIFIKNDYSGQQRYYNGKIGTVDQLSDDTIVVSFNDNTPPTIVDSYTWENKRYTLNKDSNEITEKLIGTFTHYPIKLAWAITVHKSQGLTFKKAVIDVSRAFAPGQVYVALSRLESLEGLVLTAPIPYSGLEQDDSVKNFKNHKTPYEKLKDELKEESLLFISYSVKKAFDFNQMKQELNFHINSYDKDIKRSEKQKYKSWITDIKNNLSELSIIADKFILQTENIINSAPDGNLIQLHQRVSVAKKYFEPLLNNFSRQILDKISLIKNEKGIKKYITELQNVELLFFKQLQLIYKAEALVNSALENKELTKKELLELNLYTNRSVDIKVKSKKKSSLKKDKKLKTNTKEITLKLYNSGKTVQEIAKERSLAVSTIEGHLSYYIGQGILRANQFISESTIKEIIIKAEEIDSTSLSALREAFDHKLTYSELRFAISEYNYQQK